MPTKVDEETIGNGMNTEHDDLIKDEGKENKDDDHDQITNNVWPPKWLHDQDSFLKVFLLLCYTFFDLN